METPSTFDPIKPPTITLSDEEMGKMLADIDAGVLPKDYLKKYLDAVDANVFGSEAPKDKQGWRLEIGLGSPRNQTQQSIDAYKRWCGPGMPHEDPQFTRNLAIMEKQFAECNERRGKDASKQVVIQRGRSA
jgi:hypothetical protein